MPCFYPRAVYMFTNVDTGKQVINFQIPYGKSANLMLPCSKCLGCRIEYSRQWAVRCMHEARYHDVNCFGTLTYDDEHLPYGGTLVPRDLQLFFKRLRKAVGRFRFYAGGEYGDVGERPHYHVCFFGYRPADAIPIPSRPNLFTSESLCRVWGKGFVSFGDLTFESAAYVARYCVKKIGKSDEDWVRLDPATGEIFELVPPFSRCSRGTGKEGDGVFARGVGASFVEDFNSDIYPHDSIVGSGRQLGKPPRYYDKLLEESDLEMHARVKEARKEKLLKMDVRELMNSRMRAKEACLRAKLSLRKGDL